MIGQMGSFGDPTADPTGGPLDLYIHGHSASRFMKLPSESGADSPGVPVCVAATHIDGIVLALTPFNHSCNYRSAVLHGYAETVTDEDEKLYGLRLITDGLLPGRWEGSRVPPTKTEMKSTTVLRIRIVSASAKIRAYGPGAEDRKDLKDESVSGRVWTGVVPIWEHYGDGVEGPKNLVKTIPGYIDGWIREKNREGEQYANEAAAKTK